MPDLLVNLLKLAPFAPSVASLEDEDVIIRRALPHEMAPIRYFILNNFQTGWADEISVGYANKPVSIYIAMRDGRVVGFAAYECTHRGFFGPTGVLESERGRGIGKALLLACLSGLRDMGYAYAIIGGAGPTEFYQRTVGATVIQDSVPGIYANPIKPSTDPD